MPWTSLREIAVTNIEGIYAAGDVANHWHPVFNRRIRGEHWQNAMRQGASAALNMLGRSVIYDDIPCKARQPVDPQLLADEKVNLRQLLA